MPAAEAKSTNDTSRDLDKARLMSVLEEVGTNVFISNLDLEITFINKKGRMTLKAIDAVLRAEFGLGHDEILGQCIDVFHKNPEHQRRILGNPKNLPVNAVIKVGELSLDLQVSPLYDAKGEYCGTVVNWEDVSAAKKFEADAQRVTEMMRQLPLNVMLCDSDLKLTYMNDTSYNTLKSIEGNLPVKAADMVGTCIDVFHIDPALQRKLLGNPKANLPHKVEIVIGGEDISLQADGVYDSDGEFIGCMATWTVITEQKKMQQEAADTVQRDQEKAAELQKKVEQLLVVANAAGDGDLTEEIPFGGEDAMGQLAGGFDTMITNISSTLESVNQGTNEINAGAQQIASASQSLSEGASEQAANLEEITASLEETGSMTTQNAENAKQASALSEDAAKSAGRGREEMEQMQTAMNEIKESSAKISKIIKVIDEIAFQTNLLALNAAVEAARAGEAGKGFAVVAEEVRNLAQRSAEAAKNTSTMIEESTQRAENGVSIATRVGQALEEIASSTDKVNTLLAEIASASQEQSEGINQINKGVSELDKVTQQNAGNAEELASASEETAAQVASLRELVSKFKTRGGNSGDGFTASPAPARKSGTSNRAARAAKAENAIPMDDDDFSSF